MKISKLHEGIRFWDNIQVDNDGNVLDQHGVPFSVSGQQGSDLDSSSSSMQNKMKPFGDNQDTDVIDWKSQLDKAIDNYEQQKKNSRELTDEEARQRIRDRRLAQKNGQTKDADQAKQDDENQGSNQQQQQDDRTNVDFGGPDNKNIGDDEQDTGSSNQGDMSRTTVQKNSKGNGGKRGQNNPLDMSDDSDGDSENSEEQSDDSANSNGSGGDQDEDDNIDTDSTDGGGSGGSGSQGDDSDGDSGDGDQDQDGDDDDITDRDIQKEKDSYKYATGDDNRIYRDLENNIDYIKINGKLKEYKGWM